MSAIGDHSYEAEVRWTTRGVPHIRGADLGSVTFGQGWACARDHLPTIADQLVKASGERARWHGRGRDDGHVHSDIGYSVMGLRRRAEAMVETQPEPVLDAVAGYAAGINTWLAEHGTDDLPEWCRGAGWIRPVTPVDLFTVYNDMSVVASGRNFARYIGSAAPPGEAAGTAVGDPFSIDPGLASNAWALGRDRTLNGRGMVMANPHFPWYGEARFWESHLTVPGEFDVYGVSLVGTPGIQLGFNEGVAWSHTFSRGHRFCIYKLTLDGPTTYRYEKESRELHATEHEVETLGADGSIETETFTRYESHHGPIVDLPFLGWSSDNVFALRDANLGNDRFLHQFLEMNRATSVDGLRDALHRIQGIPWVNTVAADRDGNVLYADTSTTPALTTEAEADFERSLDEDIIAALMFEQRIALLDGTKASHDWADVEGAPAPGLEAVGRLPELRTTDYVFNSNDPYWAPHATERIGRASSMAGLFERPLSPRTRTNAWLLSGTGPVTGDGDRFGPDDVMEAALGNHSLLAEQLCDDVIQRARRAGSIDIDGETVDLTLPADVLERWDRRYELDSVGAVLFREFLAGFTDAELRDAGPLFAERFDPSDFLSTPNTLAVPSEVDQAAIALGQAVLALDAAGLAPDCRLGDVQFVERSGRRFGLHGGGEVEGVTNVVMAFGGLDRDDLEPPEYTYEPAAGRDLRTGLHVGGYPVLYGVSFLMVAGFGDDGPEAKGLLVYGQSGDARSEHHADQLDDFAAKRLRPLLFDDETIDAATIERRNLTHRPNIE